MLKSGGRRTWIDRSMELKSALLHWEQLKVTLQTASTKHLNPRFTMLCPKSLAELLRMVEVDPLSTTKVGAVDRISRPRGGPQSDAAAQKRLAYQEELRVQME